MATTYDRIQHVLNRVRRRTSWDIADLAEQIRGAKQSEFKIRGQGDSPDDYMSVASIRRLVRLMIDLELLEPLQSTPQKIKISSAGATALSEDNLDLQIQSSVRSYFYRKGIGMDRVKSAVKAIELPDLPSGDAIYDYLCDPVDIDIPRDRFRTLLYLYALAGGAERIVSVYYRRFA